MRRPFVRRPFVRRPFVRRPFVRRLLARLLAGRPSPGGGWAGPGVVDRARPDLRRARLRGIGPMSRRGRRRILNETERALWAQVVRSVTPLRAQPAAPLAPAEEAPPAAPPAGPSVPPMPAPAGRQMPAVPPLASLEPKARRRLSRGAEVDARLDLHGLTQAAAHRRLRQFLKEAQARGHNVVLVITGKGERGSAILGPSLGEEARGVLRRVVPLWLAEPDLRAVVVGFEEAGRRHGGEGALYVRIRRRRAEP